MITEQTATPPTIRIVGLLGGVASGKTFVASLLGELGAAVLDGDRAGHEVLEEPEVLKAARERWGNAAFSADGSIDRRALGRIVFAGSPEGRHETANGFAGGHGRHAASSTSATYLMKVADHHLIRRRNIGLHIKETATVRGNR